MTVEQKKGDETLLSARRGAIFEYGQVLLLLICPELLRYDGSKPECWQRLSVCGTDLN